jgi:hypothetical protein
MLDFDGNERASMQLRDSESQPAANPFAAAPA